MERAGTQAVGTSGNPMIGDGWVARVSLPAGHRFWGEGSFNLAQWGRAEGRMRRLVMGVRGGSLRSLQLRDSEHLLCLRLLCALSQAVTTCLHFPKPHVCCASLGSLGASLRVLAWLNSGGGRPQYGGLGVSDR